MHRIPAPGPQPPKASGPGHISENVWAHASAMAADRAQTENGRLARTYIYAVALFTSGAVMLLLVLLGAALLLVVRIVKIAGAQVAHLVLRCFQAGPERP
jgi:hypothetical protein